MLEGLNQAQREAVVQTEGPVLVLAGAGSGKTRVLTTRIAHLIREKGISPHHILAFTFTNKAAREMQQRVLKMTPEAENSCWIGTFHATCLRILRQEAHHLGYSRYFTICDADDSRQLLSKILKDWKLDSKQFSVRDVAHRVSRFKNNFIDPVAAAVQAHSWPEEQIAKVYEEYQKRLHSSGCMDFDDLIGRTVELFENHREVQMHYSRRFRYVLVDEFQDTNPLQLVLIRALSAEYGNLFVVGDDDQSIYSWRGATVENMLGFEDYFPAAQLIRLEQNYRSTPLILRAANEVISHNRRRKGKTLWSLREEGKAIELWWPENEEEEAYQIRGRILDLLSEKGRRREDIAILYRTNAQSRALEDALRREGIPYQIVGGTRFYERREVRDLLAYLKFIANPKDQVSFARIINVPRRGLGKTSLEHFYSILETGSMTPLELCRRPEALAAHCRKPTLGRFRQFARLIDDMVKLAELSDVGTLLKQLVAAIKYEEWLQNDDPSTATERWENIVELVNAAHGFAEESDAGKLVDYLESVALLADLDRMTDGSDQVTLMTIHNAKGLEYPMIFVAGCEEGLLPHASSIEEDDAVEEERRLFYVALTRAQDRVFLYSASSRQRFGSYTPMLASRFLHELPEDCTDEKGFPGASSALAPPQPRRGGVPMVRKIRKRPSPPTSGEAPARQPWDLGAGVEAFRRSKMKQKAEGSSGDAFHAHDLNQEETVFQIGQQVQHDLMGVGVIEDVEGHGDLTRLTIRFGEAGRKRVLARYAKLRPAGDEGVF